MDFDLLRKFKLFRDFLFEVPRADEPIFGFPGLLAHRVILSNGVLRPLNLPVFVQGVISISPPLGNGVIRFSTMFSAKRHGRAKRRGSFECEPMQETQLAHIVVEKSLMEGLAVVPD